MTLEMPVVITGTYAERIAYSTSDLLFDTFWFQTDTVLDGATSYESGYWYWDQGIWSYIGTSTYPRFNLSSGLFLYNYQLAVRRDDADALIQIIAGRGTNYQAAALLFSRDNVLRLRQWIISMTGDSDSDFVIQRFDNTGTYVSNPLTISRSTGTVTIPLRLDAQYILDAQAKFYLSGDTTPAQITADQNDYSLSDTVSVVRISTDASRNITGLTGGSDGRVVVIFNVGSFNAVLVDESGSSTAANRFALKANITIAAEGSATLLYDSTSSRWRCIGTY